MSRNVEAIILAAGLSTRMRTPKLLLEIDGVPVITRVVRSSLASTLQLVTLVTGPSADDLVQALGPAATHPLFRHVMNPNPELGMSSSLRVGLSAIGDFAEGVMIVLADQPWLTAQVIDELLVAFRTHPRNIVVPTINNRRTTPVLFPRLLFADLMAVEGDVGGRDVVNRNRDKVVTVEVASRYDDSDLDTPEDVARAAGASRGGRRIQ